MSRGEEEVHADFDASLPSAMSRLPVLLLLAVLVVGVSVDAHSHRGGAHVDHGHEHGGHLGHEQHDKEGADPSEEASNEGEDENTDSGGGTGEKGSNLDPMQIKAAIEIKALTTL